MDSANLTGQITGVCVRAFEGGGNVDMTALAEEIMNLPGNIMHNPSHHYLVPAVLLTAWHKSRGSEAPALLKDLAEAQKRAEKVPGGVCGTHGACGAAIGSGIFISLATGANPKLEMGWDQANRATANALLAMAESGGPRCCKRCSFMALLCGAKEAREVLGMELVCTQPTCHYFPQNMECILGRCPFFPKKPQAGGHS